jgi:hypothetical protein
MALEPHFIASYTGSMKSAAGLAACSLLVAGCAQPFYVRRGYKPDVDRVFATYSSPNARVVAAPVALEGRPWKVGAWALYKRGGTYASPDYGGYDKISVVGEDTCGFWLAVESHGYYDRHRWLLCLRPKAPDGEADAADLVQIAIWESNGGPPDVFEVHASRDREMLRPIITMLLPPHWDDSAKLAREDVDVPAGHFMQAIRTTEKTDPASPIQEVHWVHPDVPFDGTVRRRADDGRDYLLLAYGDDGGASVVSELASALARARQPTRSPPFYASAGFGAGWFSGHGNEQSSSGADVRTIVGGRLKPKLDLIGEIAVLDAATYSPDPTASQTAFIGQLGVRWAPFRLPYLQPGPSLRGAPALYVQTDLGYTQLLRSTMTEANTVARGFVIGAAVGWLAFQGHDWGLGVELDDHLAFYGSGEGVRNAIGLVFFWQLYIGP